MTTGFGYGFELLKDVFMNSSVFGNYWIYQMAILIGTLILITRTWTDWGDLALPIVTGWHLIGFKFNYVFFVLTGMIFVINAISLKEVMGGLGAIQNVFSGRKLIKSGYGKGSYFTRKERLNRLESKSLKEYEKRIDLMEKKLKPYEKEYGVTPKMIAGKSQYERKKWLESKIVPKEIAMIKWKDKKRRKLVEERNNEM